MVNDTLQSILSRLEGVSENGNGYMARCPAHEDGKASLHISSGQDGRVLLKCHANCETTAVVAAIGLKMSDLMPPKRPRQRSGKFHIVAPYPYHDANGKLLYENCRLEPKDFRCRKPDGNGGWTWKNVFDGIERVPYRLPELLAADPAELVGVFEGEKDCDRAASLGLVTTTNVNGAGKWRPEYNRHFAGRPVAVFADNDEPGRKHAADVARHLHAVAASVKLVELPGLPPKGDVSDWLDAGGTVEELRRLVDAAAEFSADDTSDADDHDGDDDGDEPRAKTSQATLLMELSAVAVLWHTPSGDTYATIPANGHLECWPVRSKHFKRWLSGQFFATHKRAASSQALNDAINCIEGKATFGGDEHAIFNRVASHDGKLYLDLANSAWQAVEIDANGWRVIHRPPVKFRRTKAMLPLPTPTRGGSLDALRPFVNVADEDWPLILGWLVATMRDTGPYPLVGLHGEQGSSKSTTARVLRKLTDPNEAPIRSAPRDERDLMIAANNGHVVALDNLSGIKEWLSDALCRLSTGGGFSTRTLYENDEETIFSGQRPCILTGIEEIAERPDLLERSILFQLPRIPDDERRTEVEFWRKFETAWPGILGALLDAVSIGLRNIDAVRLPGKPRMADFAVWVSAAEPAFGIVSGKFLEAYTANRASANESALEASPIVKHLLTIAANGFEGRPSDLLTKLNEAATETERRQRDWPKSGSSLSGKLKRLAPNLRDAGLHVETGDRRKDGRIISIRQVAQNAVIAVTASPTIENAGENAENRGDALCDNAVTNSANAVTNGPGDAPDDAGDARGDALDANAVTPQVVESDALAASDDAGDAGDDVLRTQSIDETDAILDELNAELSTVAVHGSESTDDGGIEI